MDAAAVIRRVVREPIVHFLALGLALWLVLTSITDDRGRYTIDIDQSRIRQIAQRYTEQFGEPPNATQMHELVDQYIRDEIAYREGVGMHLDRDDEIVRRRVVQKYNFLQNDRLAVDQPDDAALQRWYLAHRSDYLAPSRTSFSQIYFSPDGDGSPTERAEAVLRRLNDTSRAPELGDPFPGPSDANDLTSEETVRVFGHSEVATKLPILPVRRWAGPFQSGYGWHLIYVTGRKPPVLLPLQQVREQVLSDFLSDARMRANEQAWAKVRRRYVVHYPEKTF
jgi:hypothetical protein